MLLVIIALAVSLLYIFVDQSRIEQDGFDFDDWIYRKYNPEGYAAEKQADEEDLQHMVDNAKDYWKKYL